jgi:adenine-specific DNA-methyltransferase
LPFLLKEDGDLVIDFFAGSGATAKALWKLNAKDAVQRVFCLVQLQEPLNLNDKDQRAAIQLCNVLGVPQVISEITKERLRRAAAKIKADNPMFVGDTGFRVFKLDSSNIHAWEPDRDNLAQSLLDASEHLKAERSENDILFELLLKLGLDLTVPIETRRGESLDSRLRGHDGLSVSAVGAGALLVCLAAHIASADVEALALGMIAWHKELAPAVDTTCVFRDSAFADDVAKTNLAAILSQHGLGNVRSL